MPVRMLARACVHVQIEGVLDLMPGYQDLEDDTGDHWGTPLVRHFSYHHLKHCSNDYGLVKMRGRQH